MTEEQFKKLKEQVGTVVAEKFAEKSDELRAGLLTEDQLKTELEAFAKAEDIQGINETIDSDQSLRTKDDGDISSVRNHRIPVARRIFE